MNGLEHSLGIIAGQRNGGKRMSFKTAIKEYGLLGIFRRIYCIIFGHDFYIGQVCIHCDEPKGKRMKEVKKSRFVVYLMIVMIILSLTSIYYTRPFDLDDITIIILSFIIIMDNK